jgi:hypothetical protein
MGALPTQPHHLPSNLRPKSYKKILGLNYFCLLVLSRHKKYITIQNRETVIMDCRNMEISIQCEGDGTTCAVINPTEGYFVLEDF